jgi:alpha-amylase/alpha-mannosidase (GH57 family)
MGNRILYQSHHSGGSGQIFAGGRGLKPLHVAILWHMHQPFYKNRQTNFYVMPWVRLHATKGYFDMIDLLEDYPDVRTTFNLVPSLLTQLMDYYEPSTLDPNLELCMIPSADLTQDQRKFMLKNFFMANWDNMIKPYPRYWELLVKRGFSATPDALEKACRNFLDQEFTDLQVWTNLAWFGYRSKKRFPEILSLIEKGKNFSRSDVERVLEVQKKVLKAVIPAYQKAAQENRIELTTTPFYHPILPLIIDTDTAKRCMPHAPLPKRFHHPEDAEHQIKKALDFFEKNMGVRPKGMWPSEGSVCPELIPILERLGIHWVATDEEILMHSLKDVERGDVLFRPYRLSCEGSEVDIVFRDRGLSDLIGFTYSNNKPEVSAKNFIQHLANIQSQSSGNGALVSVILDGENAWEHYPDGGEGFLRGVYESLSGKSEIKSTTFGAFLEKNSEKEMLYQLHSGSWIHHDFDIWIGSAEENTAWEYLGKTRAFIESLKGLPKDVMDQIYEHFYTAEGSDWFWWYGDDFSTENDVEFDYLFRLNLIRCYELSGQVVPDYLLHPVLDMKASANIQKPVGFIEPDIDGEDTHFYEWHGSGQYLEPADASMANQEKFLKRILFGFNFEYFYLRLDFFDITKFQEIEKMQGNIYLTKPGDYKIVIPRCFIVEKKKSFSLLTGSSEGAYEKTGEYSTAAFKNVFELQIPFEDLHVKRGEEMQFRVAILRDNMTLEMHPKTGYLNFIVPTKDFEHEMWSV